MPVVVEGVLRDDRLAIDLIARMSGHIPTQEWALTFGDTLHNLRSAFDAVAWGMAHFNGAQPKNPRQVIFPICTEESQWKKALKGWVGDIDPEFQERLRILQPFNYTDPEGPTSLLALLHELDIQDKHRDSVQLAVDWQAIDLRGLWYKLEDAEVDAAPRVEMRTDVKTTDGAVLGTLHTGARILPFEKIRLRPAMGIQLEYGGKLHDVPQMLDFLFIETRRYLDILMQGGQLRAEPEDPQWQPIEVGPQAAR